MVYHIQRGWRHLLQGEEGVALIEFAVTLPLMLVLVVGIFDFGSAFNLKQKLAHTAEMSARFASTLPTNDLNSAGTPNSVTSVRNTIDDYLTAEQVNDCGLTRVAGTGANLKWTFTTTTGSNGCPGPMTITIDRSHALPAVVGGVTINMISTQVTISYPYQWQFGGAFKLLTGSANYGTGVSQIAGDAIVSNMD